MKQEPPPDAKCRDKFLVQSVAVTADKEFTNITAIVRYNRYTGGFTQALTGIVATR
jgi:hypothetical protein